MKISQLGLSLVTAVSIFLGSSVLAYAAPPTIAQTWVSGTVYGPNHVPVSGGQVNVHCGSGSQLASIASDGTYGISFDQSVCKAGDTASGTASTADGSGSNAATVQNTAVNGPIVDLDIAVIDISVPEFGMVGGAITAIGAIGSYMYLRTRSLV